MKLCVLVNILQATYTLSSILGKEVMLYQGCSIMDFAFCRFLVIHIFSHFLLKMNGKHPLRDLPQESRGAMWVRSIVGTLTFTVVNVGILLLPLSVGTLLVYAAPFFTAILTRFFLKEEVPLMRWLCLVGSFGGIIMISCAGPDAENSNKVDENSFFGSFSTAT